MNTELKNEYMKVICDTFYSVKPIVGMEILDYKVDLYLETIEVVVEFGEEFDKEREERIIEYLANQSRAEDQIRLTLLTNVDYRDLFTYVRIKEGELGIGIRKISKHISEVIGSNPYQYMDPYFRGYNPDTGSCEDDSSWDINKLL